MIVATQCIQLATWQGILCIHDISALGLYTCVFGRDKTNFADSVEVEVLSVTGVYLWGKNKIERIADMHHFG